MNELNILRLSREEYEPIKEAGVRRYGDFSNLGCTIVSPDGEVMVVVNQDGFGGRFTEAIEAHEATHVMGGSEEDCILAEFMAVGEEGGKAALAEYQAIPRRECDPEHSQDLRMECFWQIWQETE